MRRNNHTEKILDALSRLDERMKNVDEKLDTHGKKLDDVMPTIASHTTSLTWIKKSLGVMATVIGSVFTYLFMK